MKSKVGFLIKVTGTKRQTIGKKKIKLDLTLYTKINSTLIRKFSVKKIRQKIIQ